MMDSRILDRRIYGASGIAKEVALERGMKAELQRCLLHWCGEHNLHP